MKKYIVFLSAVIILIGISIIGVKIYNENHKEEIFKDENKQVNALKNIIEDFKTAFNFEDDNIYLDETCFNNLIDNTEYSEENKNILKQTQQINEEYYLLCTMYLKYNIKDSILTITLKDEQERRINLQRYKLDVKNDEIIFERYGMSEVGTFSPSNMNE